ncbi:MAG: nucleotidyltransferase family protein [Candidatus Helarchaeota archaeon]|nr:nucleotidyltransferase family protein [Candidatus Helarchaeota archaeon]
MKMLKEQLYNKIISFLMNYGASKIAIFGSYARGNNDLESDIDIIVEFSEGKSLLDHVKIERELSEELEIKVDLLTEKSISQYLIEDIKKEMEVIYE